ncbi:MAG: hypothetical protein K5837_01400 [Candidatus Saccharibacteria bacterium]|nr:hypothetical protein [Candidatus Saccharibacteria bacterium]
MGPSKPSNQLARRCLGIQQLDRTNVGAMTKRALVIFKDFRKRNLRNVASGNSRRQAGKTFHWDGWSTWPPSGDQF